MKKIFLISAFAFSLIASAQSNKVVNLLSSYGKTSDTLTNSTANYLSIPLASKYQTISVQPRVTKISGTCTYTVTLQGSIDGTNYLDITNTGDSLMATTTSTVTPTTNVMIIANPGYTYIRLKGIGTGTMSATFSAVMMVQPTPGNGSGTANFKSAYGNTTDTVTNTATNYISLSVTNSYTKIVIQPIVTKISGTVAGTVTLQGSNDALNYVTVNTSYLLGGSATLTATNVTTSTNLFVVTGSPYEYYRLSYTGSGTMSATLKGLLSAK